MPTTVDNQNSAICSAIKALRGICEADKLTKLYEECCELLVEFHMLAAPLLVEYRSGGAHRMDINRQMTAMIHDNRIVSRIHEIDKATGCRVALPDLRVVDHLDTTYNTNTEQRHCPCGGQYHTKSFSELVCIDCGCIHIRYESLEVSDAEQTKRGQFDPISHCRLWLDRIQALDIVDISPDILDRFRALMARENIRHYSRLSCETLRGYVRTLGLESRYNDVVPLIRKKLTGIAPSPFSPAERAVILDDFRQIVEAFPQIESDKLNLLYYPFFIRKILERRFYDQPTRLKSWIDVIHLQNAPTLQRNDSLFREICQLLPHYYNPIPTLAHVETDAIAAEMRSHVGAADALARASANPGDRTLGFGYSPGAQTTMGPTEMSSTQTLAF
jgi:hypothetical protein